MCNIAGYVGTKNAAPILVDMMRCQEGWDGGHYIGMATVSDNKLFLKKDVGSLEMLMEKFDLTTLPGTVGFIHSRTPGGKGQDNEHWAHPFMGRGGDFAYIVNGCGGAFYGKNSEQSAKIYMSLKAEGYCFETATPIDPEKQSPKPDGMYVHPTDVKCQMVQRNIDRGMCTPDAMAAAMFQTPSEVVCLGLRGSEPDRISWSRMNYPMFAGFADHGIYLATTPQAIPEDARNITLLSPLSCGSVYRDRVETKPFLDTDITVAPITPGTWKRCYEAMEQELKFREMHHDSLDRLIRPLFEESTCPPESAVDYAIMDHFERTGRLQVRIVQKPGTAPDSTAPKRYARL